MHNLKCQINGGGVLINRRLAKIPKVDKWGGVKINGGVRILEKALNDYTRMERTKTGCHKTKIYTAVRYFGMKVERK